MNPTYLPTCCSPLSDHWPLPRAVAGAQLISTRFDANLLQADDFSRAAIPAVRGVAKRQAEHLAGRLCAREALRRVTGTASVPAVGEDRAPQWPAQACGSITHGHSWAAAIVAPRQQWRGLGLDVERPLPPERAERLAAEILTPDELRRMARLEPEQRAWRISLTFSLKESLFKALYPLVLTRFYFQDAELLELDEQGNARLRLLLDLSADWPAGSELSGMHCAFDDHLLSLVSIGA
ncbi:4'-phosphopantetheinyl transferase family protein [Phytopseudomonas dryadis]|uniref:Enterobactin synthase component D n=2 Tax=Pseudomonadaceae TaxID=135621 RepID=A0A4Q9R2D6_9GAMM|nr:MULTISPECIES: 4'-phosphopantetheinyl transferase superfamily protein [Pseudomonas]TBU93453.1 4'-phosphopantetheinyl transferase [Pseudomonas dryadis]TBV07158.1 4'-phosphopantetheinyl transferase [Pseudomonas dryadis]TBV19569.1 4'-phosphopantetheinyl transferase [Pseudomonas sp. FRB 230]